MLTAVRRLSGQRAGEPSRLAAQSRARMRRAISLSPGNRRAATGRRWVGTVDRCLPERTAAPSGPRYTSRMTRARSPAAVSATARPCHVTPFTSPLTWWRAGSRARPRSVPCDRIRGRDLDLARHEAALDPDQDRLQPVVQQLLAVRGRDLQPLRLPRRDALERNDQGRHDQRRHAPATTATSARPPRNLRPRCARSREPTSWDRRRGWAWRQCIGSVAQGLVCSIWMVTWSMRNSRAQSSAIASSTASSRTVAAHDRVRRQRVAPRGQRPHVQVVHLARPGHALEALAERLHVDVRRHRLHQHVHGLAHEAEGAHEHEARDDGAGDGIDRRPAREPDDHAGDDGADRAEEIGDDVQVGAADAEAVMLVLAEPTRDDHVHDQARGRDEDERAALDGGRLEQPAPGRRDDEQHEHAQDDAVHQRGQDLRAVPAERLRVARLASRDPRANRASARAPMSVSMWMASLTSARLLVHHPPTSSTPQRRPVSPSAETSARCSLGLMSPLDHLS